VDATIQVGKRGIPTPPSEFRARHNIQPGDGFRLLDLNGIFVLTPMVPELAREIEPTPVESGLNVEEMLHGLRDQRERYYAAKHGGDQGLA